MSRSVIIDGEAVWFTDLKLKILRHDAYRKFIAAIENYNKHYRWRYLDKRKKV